MTSRNFISGKSSESARVDESSIRDIRRMATTGEGSRIEFKAKANHPDKIARSICSFANSTGGTLLLGVSDAGELNGVRYPDEDIHAIFKYLRTARPFLKCRYSIIPITDKRSVVRFDVSENRRKPVVLKMDKGKAFIRIADACMQAGPVTSAVLRERSSSTGSMITFGSEEKSILSLFNSNKPLVSREIIRATGLPEKVVFQKLVSLVSAGILKTIPGNEEEQFLMNLSGH